VIDYTKRTLADVTTQVKGWVEELHVSATGDLVKRGASTLRNLFARKLYSAQVEYLLAIGSRRSPIPLQTRCARARSPSSVPGHLRSADRGTGADASGEEDSAILAPQDGFVVEKMVVEGQIHARRHEVFSACGSADGLECRRRLRAATCPISGLDRRLR